MKELIKFIARELVDFPDQVSVEEIEGNQTSVIELKVAKEDLGKVIGKQIHEAIENYIINNQLKVDTEYEEEVIYALKSFVLFRTEHPEIELSMPELALTSELYKFNGTIDIIGNINKISLSFMDHLIAIEIDLNSYIIY